MNNPLLTDAELADLLIRFNGEPGQTVGLTMDELKKMLQHLINTEKIYTAAEDIQAFAEEFQAGGLVSGYNLEKIRELTAS